MSTLQLHPNMLLGVTLDAQRAEGPVDPEAPAHRELTMLRTLGVKTCVVCCDWAALEPEADRFDREALEALRSQLIGLRALDISPLLCLWNGADPGWFTRLGGWTQEENVGRFCRYAQTLVHTLGHLVAEYLTLAEPNNLSLRGLRRRDLAFSALCAAHLRCYRTIHQERRRLGFRETAVGFALHMAAPEGGAPALLRPLPGTHHAEVFYQQLMLRAMARGEFARPLRNLSYCQPGLYCDFLGFTYGVQTARLSPRRRRDDLGREIWPEGLERCCAELLKAAPRPVYLLDRGACDWDDSFRARYIYEHLQIVCASHQPVLRYYYHPLQDGNDYVDGLEARRGLFYRDQQSGAPLIKESGRFFAALVREGCVTDELFARYVAGREYRR